MGLYAIPASLLSLLSIEYFGSNGGRIHATMYPIFIEISCVGFASAVFVSYTISFIIMGSAKSYLRLCFTQDFHEKRCFQTPHESTSLTLP